MDYKNKCIAVLILLCFVFTGIIYAQIEDIPRSADEEIEEAPPGEPPAAQKSADAYTSAIQEVDLATELYNELKANGHVILDGIFFSKGKADLAAKSDTCLEAIAQMMKDYSKMKVYIVGHTDNKGHIINLMKFSEQRASAVMDVLTDLYGIDMNRIFISGVGPMCPIATNETEDGRAQNNRIELVLQ